MNKNHYTSIDSVVVKQVRCYARKLIRHPSMRGMDVEDLEQQLITDYWLRQPRYDATKAAYKTFVNHMLAHQCIDLIRTARAQKRGANTRTISWEDWHIESNDEPTALLEKKPPSQSRY